MASNSTNFWNLSFPCANSNEYEDLKQYDSLEEAFLAMMNYADQDHFGPGERKFVIYFP